MIRNAIKGTKKNNWPEHLFIKSLFFNHQSGTFSVELRNGKVMVFPLTYSERLKNATPIQRERWELIASGVGVHWEEIDEDLSAKGFIREYIKQNKAFIKENESLVV